MLPGGDWDEREGYPAQNVALGLYVGSVDERWINITFFLTDTGWRWRW